MKPALTITGVIITALARLKFRRSQSMLGSPRKLDSVASEAAMCACGSACAQTFGTTNTEVAATRAAIPAERSNLDNMSISLTRTLGDYQSVFIGSMPAPPEAGGILRLLDARDRCATLRRQPPRVSTGVWRATAAGSRSEEHTSELQSH